MSEYQAGRARTSETLIKEIEKQVSDALTEMFRRAVKDGTVQDKKDEKSDVPTEGVVQDCEFGMILLLGRAWLKTRQAVPKELADDPVREMVIKLVSSSLETLLNRKRFDVGGEFGDKVFFSGAPYTLGARGSSANLDSAMLVLGFLAPALKEYHDALSKAPGPANKPAPWIANLRDLALFVCMEGVKYATNCQVRQQGFVGFTCDPKSIWSEQDKTKPYLDEYDRLFFTWTASETICDLTEWGTSLNEIADGVPAEELAALRSGIQGLGGAIEEAALWCKSVFLERLRNLQQMNVAAIVDLIGQKGDAFLPESESKMVDDVAKYVQHVYHMSQYAAIRSLYPAQVTIDEVNDILDRLDLLVSDDILGSGLDASEQPTLFTTLTREYSLGVGVNTKYEDDAYYPLVVRSMATLLTRTMDRLVQNATINQITNVVVSFRRVLRFHHRNLVKRRPAAAADKDLWSFADKQPYTLYATQRTIFALLTYADFLKKMDDFDESDDLLEADAKNLLSRELVENVFGKAVKEIVSMAMTRASARGTQAEVAGDEVFISYKSEDRAYAVKVRGLLRAAGVTVWVDLEGIDAGEYYVANISQAIEACKAVVLICTAKALASKNVQDEIEASRQAGKRLIPLMFETDVEIPGDLRVAFARLQYKYAVGRADDEWMADLLAALKKVGVPSAAAPLLAPRDRIYGDLPHVLADHFQNRVEELAALRAHLSDPAIHLVIVSGHRGAGKTALVTRLVQEEAASNAATSVLYLALNESSTVDAIIELLAAALPGAGLVEAWKEQSPLADKLEFLFQQLKSARCWIVLDDFERISTGSSVQSDFEAFIEACLRRDHQARIIAVSNEDPMFPERFETDFVTRKAQVDIEKGLDAQYGIALLRSLKVDQHLGIADTNDEFLGRVVELCSGYPRLLKMLIARVSSQKIETLREFVEDEQGFAQFLDDPVRDVYDNLPAVERQVAQVLAVFDDPVNWKAIDDLLDRSVRKDLVRLRQRYVVYFRNRGVELHPLYRRYAYEQIPDKDPGGFDRPSLHKKAASYFQRQQKAIETLADVEPYACMCRQLMRAGLAADAEAFLYGVEMEMCQRGFSGPIVAIRTQLEELLTEPGQKGQNLRCLGIALSEMGEPAAAIEYYTQSLAIGDAIGDAPMQTMALINMGWACNELGFFDRALEHLTEADRRFPEPERKSGLAGALIGNLADAELNLGRLESGISRSEEALKLHDSYPAGKVVWLGNLGVAHQNLGDLDKAIAYFKQALAIEEKEKLMRRMRVELCRLGRAHLETGDAESSFDYYQKANQLAAEIADKPSQSRALYGAGTAFHAKGDRNTARQRYEAALAVGVEKTSHHCLNKLGLLCLQEEKRGEANERFSRAIAVCDKLIARSSAFEPLYQRAFAYLGSQASAPALADYRQALEQCSARGVVASVLRELRLLQRACETAGVQEAINLLEQARC